ncbi:ethanolamine ammonia-lyase light chain [Rhizobium sp. PP-F2F-G20b]|nr:ethanolamine ammonia-lyase light chain [Rhizobium sp. PP-F2F-G20b]
MAKDLQTATAHSARLPENRNMALTALTDARVGLGRVGASMPTEEVLKFAYAHARARDAVHADFDVDTLADALEAIGLRSVSVRSAAPDRMTYLRRPDLGRRLADDDRERLDALQTEGVDIGIVVADGLSATAVHVNAVPFLAALLPLLHSAGLTVGPVTFVQNARVAVGDEIGALLRARLVLVLIGERPGLSSADSLGVYLTHGPLPGRSDAERNCISNIREGGLVPPLAARKAMWLVNESLRRQLSGVALKEEEATLIGTAAEG